MRLPLTGSRPGAPISNLLHVYDIRPRKDHRGFDLISDALAFGRLRIVDFQAENDEGDLADMARGMLKHSNFTKAEQRLILENYFRYDLRGIGGEKFLAIARKKVREHKADLLWFDALQNYLGGNVRDGEKLQAIAPVVSQAQEEAQTAEAPTEKS